MRCRVCGFVADPEAEKCPNCGAKLPVTEKKAAAAEGEMSWNTRDFPKPKEMTDIKMSWPDIRSHTVSISEEEIKEALDKKEPVAVLSEDATEGYFSKPAREEKKEEPKPAAEAPAKEAEPRTIELKTAPELKPEEGEQAPSFWYTQKFTATGVMQTGPAWPAASGNSKPSYPTTATIETMTLSEPVPITAELAAAAAEAAAKKQATETAPSGFTLEEILQECSDDDDEDDIPRVHPEDHFYTFKKKNEEFQKLLDLEYDKFHAMHGEDKDLLRGNTGRPFEPEETVQAKELSAFERMLFEGVPQQTEETPAQKFFSQDAEPEVKKPVEKAAEPEAQAEPAGLAELLQQKSTADTKDPDPGLFVIPTGDPSKYNIEEIEHTIRELQAQEIEAENNRSERKKRLEAMAAAREAYFASLDAQQEKKHWFSRDKKQESKPAKPAEPVKHVEAAPAEEPVLDASILDASPIGDIFDDPDAEPTKEIPVGNILKALAAGGVAAASAAAAKTEQDASSRVKTAAMSAAAPSITEDVFRTRVFTRPLSEEAEELARRYEQPAEKKADVPEDLAKKYEEPAAEEQPAAKEPVIENPAVEEPVAEAPVFEEPAVEAAAVEELLNTEPEELPSLRELVEKARAAEVAKAAEPVEPAEPAEEPAAETAETAEQPAEEPAPVTEAFIQEAAQEAPAHSTQPFDVDAIEKAAAAALSRPLGEEEPKDDEDEEDEDDEPGSRHIVLKIIAIILIICALFEGAVLGLKKFAPESSVTESAVQIEEAIGEAVMSFFDTVSDGINRIFHKGN